MLITILQQELENQLDEITTGKEGWIKVLEMFWKDFNQNIFRS